MGHWPDPPASPGVSGTVNNPKKVAPMSNVGGTVTTNKETSSDGVANSANFPPKAPSDNRPA